MPPPTHTHHPQGKPLAVSMNRCTLTLDVGLTLQPPPPILQSKPRTVSIDVCVCVGKLRSGSGSRPGCCFHSPPLPCTAPPLPHTYRPAQPAAPHTHTCMSRRHPAAIWFASSERSRALSISRLGCWAADGAGRSSPAACRAGG